MKLTAIYLIASAVALQIGGVFGEDVPKHGQVDSRHGQGSSNHGDNKPDKQFLWGWRCQVALIEHVDGKKVEVGKVVTEIGGEGSLHNVQLGEKGYVRFKTRQNCYPDIIEGTMDGHRFELGHKRRWTVVRTTKVTGEDTVPLVAETQ
ncbi:hypothetical protein MCOR27_006563 [Pyricularia oryzae]|nr:hypothetical protein MCOR27_006563 [Pyricularia oryzae]KAI6645460.1 hypothetical protein MCOR14_000126 [Pyricularia oryzae]